MRMKIHCYGVPSSAKEQLIGCHGNLNAEDLKNMATVFSTQLLCPAPQGYLRGPCAEDHQA